MRINKKDALDSNYQNSAIKRKVHNDLISMLFKQLRLVVPGDGLLISVYYYSMLHTPHSDFLTTWYATNMVLCVFSRIIIIELYHNPKTHHLLTPQGWLNLIAFFAALSGAYWGAIGSVLMPEALDYQLFVAFLLVGVSAIANSFYSPFTWVYAIFLLPSFGPFTIWLFISRPMFALVGISACVFIFLSLVASFIASRWLFQSKFLSYKNEKLAENVTRSKESVEKINKNLLSEIHLRKETEKSLEALATHDVLTGLPNRFLFHQNLNSAFARADRNGSMVAVLFLDLDNFKKVNDVLGHDIGDHLLQEMASRLQKDVRMSDVISRLGGDEFTIILENIKSKNEIATVAQKIITSISDKPFLIKKNDLFITSSMGISVYPHDGNNIKDLVKNSDVAMYKAKQNGGNNYQFYTQEMSELIIKKQSIESDLRHAIEKKQLILYYQPQVDITNGKIIGLEALIRWNHPKLGLLYPDTFIHIAEESDLIITIGYWVIETACKQLIEWQSLEIKDLKVAVNVSVPQFLKHDFIDNVKNIFDSTGIDPKYLEFELTENIFMQNIEKVTNIMKSITDLGIDLSLDDFGTGYSSLSYLKRLPISVLKIDRAFIMDVLTSSEARSITEIIIALAKSLKLKVIAEGVESTEQLEFLKKSGCHLIQGYLFSPPLPPDRIYRLLTEQKTKK